MALVFEELNEISNAAPKSDLEYNMFSRPEDLALA